MFYAIAKLTWAPVWIRLATPQCKTFSQPSLMMARPLWLVKLQSHHLQSDLHAPVFFAAMAIMYFSHVLSAAQQHFSTFCIRSASQHYILGRACCWQLAENLVLCFSTLRRKWWKSRSPTAEPACAAIHRHAATPAASKLAGQSFCQNNITSCCLVSRLQV